jgi:very-short-patch-repair endonuclease
VQTGLGEVRALHVTPLHVDRAVAGIARRQHGLVTTEQLLAAGLGERAIAGRVRRGTLERLHRGVYLIGAPDTRTPYLAAVLACGPAALLSHQAAAVVWGILKAGPGPVDVTVTHGHRRSRRGVRVHHTSAPGTRRDGIPVTTALRTLEDLRGSISDAAYERALNEARVLRLPTPAGSAPAELTRSEAERRLLRLIDAAGLPRPRTNVKVCGHEVDLFWPEHALVVEFDGWTTHSSRAAFERDRLRDADLQLAGNRVVRVTHRQIGGAPYELVARLAAALSSIRPVAGPLVN